MVLLKQFKFLKIRIKSEFLNLDVNGTKDPVLKKAYQGMAFVFPVTNVKFLNMLQKNSGVLPILICYCLHLHHITLLTKHTCAHLIHILVPSNRDILMAPWHHDIFFRYILIE